MSSPAVALIGLDDPTAAEPSLHEAVSLLQPLAAQTYLWEVYAALAEIAGCYLPYLWLREQRSAWLLLVENADGAVLLERRPPSGIWGGLWCAPVIPSDQDWRDALHARYALDIVGEPQALPVVEHGFTHYDLSLQPLRIRVAAQGVAAAAETAWTTMHDSNALPGLPAPVRKIIDAAYFAPKETQQTLWPEPSTA